MSDEGDGEQPARKRRKKSAEEVLHSQLHPRDVENFLQLSHALRILLSGRLTEDNIRQAEDLIATYCSDLIEVGAV